MKLKEFINNRNLTRNNMLSMNPSLLKSALEDAVSFFIQRCREVKNKWWKTKAAEIQTLIIPKVFTKPWELCGAKSEPPRTTANPWQQNNNYIEAWSSCYVEGPLCHTVQWTVNSWTTIKGQPNNGCVKTWRKWVRLCFATKSQTDYIQKLLREDLGGLSSTLHYLKRCKENLEVPTNWKNAHLVTIFKCWGQTRLQQLP